MPKISGSKAGSEMILPFDYWYTLKISWQFQNIGYLQSAKMDGFEKLGYLGYVQSGATCGTLNYHQFPKSSFLIEKNHRVGYACV